MAKKKFLRIACEGAKVVVNRLVTAMNGSIQLGIVDVNPKRIV